ncbi:MAG: RNA polymerase sigma factor [Deltaproteobacteria bacterium]|nr:RNA polymerase sigma factor [Deltaproteobacteria bacterium]
MNTTKTFVTSIYNNRHLDDGELVERALAGDSWSEEAIFHKYVNQVSSVAAKLLRQHAEVDDVVQDTFVQAFRDLKHLNDPSKLKPWLIQIVVHRSHARFRKRSWVKFFSRASSIDDEKLIDQVRVEATQETLAEIAMLDRAFDKMKLTHRTCWILKHLEGYQLTEIASITGVSLATVKRRISAASEYLQNYVEQGGLHD